MNNEIKHGRKKSGIKKELNCKISDWLASIDDVALREKAKNDAILTGGAIASMLLGEPVNDYDIYFRTIETSKAVAEYYMKEMFGDGFAKTEKTDLKVNDLTVIIEEKANIKGEIEPRVINYIRSSGVYESKADSEKEFRVAFISSNAITLSDKVQLINRFHGDPAQIHRSYDFVHAKSYLDYHNNELYLDPEALECLLSRTLVYRGSLYPVASIFRMKKFIERGWRISAGQQLKIMWQISELDLSDKEVLQDQLTGVDQAYLQVLINALKDVESEKITSSYAAAVIDKIFNEE